MINENTDRDLKLAASQHIKEKEYWLNKFSGELNNSYFPYDIPQGKLINETGAMSMDLIEFTFPPDLVSRLIQLSKGSLHTLHIILTTLLAALLGRYTGSRDITIGTPIFQQYTEGKFINTVLPLRNAPQPGITFKEFLLQVKQTVMEAVEHQQFPVEILPSMLNPKGSSDDISLFETAILLEDIQDKRFILHLKPQVVISFKRTDSCIRGAVEYPSSLYEKATIDRIIAHYSSLSDRALRDVNQKIHDIEILSGAEKKQLLVDFNNTTAEYPRHSTIHQLFAEQVEKTPDYTALVGEIPNPHTPNAPGDNLLLTYKELNENSHGMSCSLKEIGIKPDMIVGITMEPSLQMIIGILGILKAGGAYLPIDPGYPQERITYMLNDSGAETLLTGTEILGLSPIYSSTRLPSYPAKPLNLAYIIYTSGTTGKPKGMMIQHQNVVRLMINNRSRFDFNNNDVWTMFHSFCFDFSVWEIYGALLYGGKLILIPVFQTWDPAAYLQTLKKQQVTVLNQTPSAFSALSTIELNQPRKHLNLRYIIFGGEALNPKKLKKWNEKYPAAKLINMYGITETTVHVTYKEISQKEIDTGMSNIGQPIPTLKVYVVDNNMKPVPIGVPGECCVAGDGVGRGYLNHPELTAEKFERDLWDYQDRYHRSYRSHRSYKSYMSYIPQKIYKAGDRVRRFSDGDLEYLGRIDQQVKIRGFRIELEEIKNQLLSIDGIADAVVTTSEDKWGETYIAAYLVAENEENIDILKTRDLLSHHLPGYMIPAYFRQIEKIPLTVNGKIDLKELPEIEFRSSRDYAAPRDELEEKLVEIWSQVLDIEKENIGIDSDFFQLGGHSLKATRLTALQLKTLNIKMPVVEVFKSPTIRQLAEYIKKAQKDIYQSIPAVEEKEYYPASSAQKRMIILNQIKGDDISDNVSTVIHIDGELDVPILEKVIKHIIKRHLAFRTSFNIIDETHVQRIHKTVHFEIQHKQSHDNKDNIERIIEEFIRPFDLTRAPLLRVCLLQLLPTEHILIFDMHHIISDAVSREILTNEFLVLFNEKKLMALRLQYKDFTCWQNELLQSDYVKKQEEYWLNQFSGEIPTADMPLDYPRPPVQSFAGDYFDFQFDEDLTLGINQLVSEKGATLYMVLLAIYTILLSKYYGQEDIVLGTPIAGRPHADLENIIGFFVNTLAMRNYPQREKTFFQFLEEVKTNALNAYENQDYQFEELVEKLELTRDQSRSILFDTMFAVQNAANLPKRNPQERDNTPDKTEYPTLSYYKYKEKGTQFDIITHAFETSPCIEFKLRFSTTLFKRETIEKFINDFKEIAQMVTENIHIKIKDIHLSHDFVPTNIDVHQYDQGDFEF